MTELEVLFRRDTHNPDGTFKEELEGVAAKCAGLGVHALNAAVPIPFSKFVEIHMEYENVHGDKTPSVVQLLRDLANMVEAGLAEAIVR